MPMTFHIARVDDIPLIQELASQIWNEHFPGIITHEQIAYMLEKMYAADILRQEIESRCNRYVLLMSDGTPVGFIASMHDEIDRAIKISKLYLLPALHGRGIGRQMLDYVKRDSLRMGATMIYLFVNKRNAKAILAYEQFGFVKTAAVITDIGDGFMMDDHRMELRL